MDQNEPPTLLIVDDEASWRKRLIKLGESLGFTVITAIDGGDAMEMLESHQETVALITDVNMAPIDGIALLRHIKAGGAGIFPKTLVFGESTYKMDGHEFELERLIPPYFGEFARFKKKSVDLAEARAFLQEILAARQ